MNSIDEVQPNNAKLHPTMASKHSRMTQGGDAVVTGSPLVTEYDRLIQKKRYKDAVKQAKLCYKQESSPENHARLERAYYLRAKELCDLGMRDSAREVIGHLVEFGIQKSDGLLDLCQLLITLGLDQKAVEIQERLGTADDKARLMEVAADMAVTHPERAGQTSPELVREARLVRHAIERLETGDETAASEVLRDLARSSILSEWKYFVRGLSAFRRNDTEAQKMNWGRLDPKRAAARIAQRLRGFAALKQSGSDGPDEQKLEKLVFGESVIAQVRRIAMLVAEQEWMEILRQLAPLRETLRRIDAKLPERLTRAMLGSLIHQASECYPRDAERLIDRFTQVAEPLAIDPNWNRLRAIIWDASQSTWGEARVYWSRYIEDLKSIPGFTPQERPLAQAIVLNHKAQSLQRDLMLDDDDDEIFPAWPPGRNRSAMTPKETKTAKAAVVDCLEESLRLAPEYLPTYRSLVDFSEFVDDADKMEASALRLLKAFPDDLETLTLLAGHYLSRDNPAAALPWAQQARKLKPLDDSLREGEWATRIDLARRHALAKRFEDGRAEFAAAEQLFPDRSRHYAYLARKAIFEAKARETDRSAALIAEAQLGLIEPAPLWLALSIQSIRYQADRKSRDVYARLWTAELKKTVKSETAGEMAGLLDSILNAGIEYAERDTQVNKLVTYLGRTLKLTYRRVDLERVCNFLGHVPTKLDLLKRLVKRGLSTHPESARLHFEAGSLEFRMGVLGGSPAVGRQHLQKAVELAESSTEKADRELLPHIKEVLSQLNDLADGPLGALFFGGFPSELPSPRRQSGPRRQPRSRAKSDFADPFQMLFPLFFDGDEMEPDLFDPEGPSARPKGRPTARGRKKS